MKDYHEVKPITKEEILNLFKLEKSMCKISFEIPNGSKGMGTGFFCELDNNFPIKYALFTNNHILNESNIEVGKKIKFECLKLQKSFFSSSYINTSKQIEITNKRKVFTNKELDYTCIELFESDGIIDYFKIEPKLYKNDKNYLKDSDIFLLQFPKGNDISFSYGKILSFKDNSIFHNASTDYGSAGSPIILRSNKNYIIGIHKGVIMKDENDCKFKLGTSFDSILDNIKQQNK